MQSLSQKEKTWSGRTVTFGAEANNPRKFWRLIDKITNHSTGEEMPISVEDLGEYFKFLLDDKSENIGVNPSAWNSDTVPILDEPIDESEIRAALKALKKEWSPRFGWASSFGFQNVSQPTGQVHYCTF